MRRIKNNIYFLYLYYIIIKNIGFLLQIALKLLVQLALSLERQRSKLNKINAIHIGITGFKLGAHFAPSLINEKHTPKS